MSTTSTLDRIPAVGPRRLADGTAEQPAVYVAKHAAPDPEPEVCPAPVVGSASVRRMPVAGRVAAAVSRAVRGSGR